MMNAQEVFNNSVQTLPRDERLRLAALILQDLTHPAAASAPGERLSPEFIEATAGKWQGDFERTETGYYEPREDL